MTGPENLRVYGLLLRDHKVLISSERVAGRNILKFPGGAVESGETPEEALVREFDEECQLLVRPIKLLNAPGTLFSPWTFTYYTPLYYEVTANGEPESPELEPIEIAFRSPETTIGSGRMALPEIVALRRALVGWQTT